MKRIIFACLCLLAMSGNVFGSVLVYSANGTYVTKASLAAASTSADVVGKKVVVTTVAGEPVTTAVTWPANTPLVSESGGWINISGGGSITGLKECTPDLFGKNTTPGTTDMTKGVQDALKYCQTIRFKSLYKNMSTVVVTSGKDLEGDNYETTGLEYGGTGTALRLTPSMSAATINSSGYGQTRISNMRIKGYGGSTTTGAGIELQSGGYSYYDINHVHVTGTFKYGVIFDQSEISTLKNSIIDNRVLPNTSVGVLITNGDDWTTGALRGFTNRISIEDNMINGQTVGIADDGGGTHSIRHNYVFGNALAIRLGDASTPIIRGNGFENAVGDRTALSVANLLLTDTTYIKGTATGPVQGGEISGNAFGANLTSGHLLNTETSTGFHTGLVIAGNTFGSVFGRGGAINVEKLSSSAVGPNIDYGSGSMAHYVNVHNDADGNVLYPPQNGASVTGQGGYTYGRGGLDQPSDGYKINSQTLQSFTLVITNDGGTLKHKIINGANNSVTAAYAGKISGASATLAATPTVNGSTGFTSGVGIVSNSIVLNTGDQVDGSTLFSLATVESYDGNVSQPVASIGHVLRDVNGTTIYRIEIPLTTSVSGAAWTINTTNIPSGKSIAVKVLAWVR